MSKLRNEHEKRSEVLQIRIRPRLHDRIRDKAQKLSISETDIMRVALALGLNALDSVNEPLNNVDEIAQW